MSSRARLLDGQKFDYGFQATDLNSKAVGAESKKDRKVEMAAEARKKQYAETGDAVDSVSSSDYGREIELRSSEHPLARLSKFISPQDQRIKEILPAAAVAVAASVAVVAIFRMKKPK